MKTRIDMDRVRGGILRKGNLEIKLSVFIPTIFTETEYREPLNQVMNHIFGEVLIEGLKRERELVINESYQADFGKKYATYPCFFAYGGTMSRDDVFNEMMNIFRENMKSLVDEEEDESVVREIISGIKLKLQ